MKFLIFLICFVWAPRFVFATVTAQIVGLDAPTKTAFDRRQYYFEIKNNGVVLKSTPVIDHKGEPIFSSLIFGNSSSLFKGSVGVGQPWGNRFVFPILKKTGDVHIYRKYLFNSSGVLLSEVLSPVSPVMIVKSIEQSNLALVRSKFSNDQIPLIKRNGDPLKVFSFKKQPRLIPIELNNGWFIFEIDQKIYLTNPQGQIVRRLGASPQVRSLKDLIVTQQDGSQLVITQKKHSSTIEILKTNSLGFSKDDFDFKGQDPLYFTQSDYGYFVAVLTNEDRLSSTVLTFDKDKKLIDTYRSDFLIKRSTFGRNLIYLSGSPLCSDLLTQSSNRARLLVDPNGKIHRILD